MSSWQSHRRRRVAARSAIKRVKYHASVSKITKLFYGKNDFAEALKNLARYRSESYFVGPSK